MVVNQLVQDFAVMLQQTIRAKVETAQVGSVIIRSWLGAHDRELHDFPI